MYGIAFQPAVSAASTLAWKTIRPDCGAKVADRLAVLDVSSFETSALLSPANGTSRTTTAPDAGTVTVHGAPGAVPVADASNVSCRRYTPAAGAVGASIPGLASVDGPASTGETGASAARPRGALPHAAPAQRPISKPRIDGRTSKSRTAATHAEPREA